MLGKLFIMPNVTYVTTPQPLYAVFWDHPDEPVPEENFWTLWCKGRLIEADTPTIRLGATSPPPTMVRRRCRKHNLRELESSP